MNHPRTRRTVLKGAMGLVSAATASNNPAHQAEAQGDSIGVPMFRGNLARTGEHPGPGPFGQIRPLWRTRLGTKISSTPAVGNGIVCVGSNPLVVGRANGGLGGVYLVQSPSGGGRTSRLSVQNA